MTQRPSTSPRFATRLARFVEARPEEVPALLLAFGYHLLILTSYFILRPIRDDMGVAGGVSNVPLLWTGTLAATLVAQPLYAALVRRLPRTRFIPYTYWFFISNLGLFYLALGATGAAGNVWVGRVFYVWSAVFNLFITTVFWSLMVDLFGDAAGRRLFGFIAAGGSLGAILGSAVTAGLVESLGQRTLLLVSAGLLQLAVLCVHRLARPGMTGAGGDRGREVAGVEPAVVGGELWAGVGHVLRSPYLTVLALFLVFFTIGSSFLYIQQAAIVEAAIVDRAARTAFFARVDLAVNVMAIVGQAWLTARLVRWLGVTWALAVVPLVSVAGFLALAVAPLLWTLVAVQAIRRAANFAAARPVRELLYTAVSREDKYKAKGFIDTFVYRLGDQIGAWSNAGLGALGLGLAGISMAGAGISLLWLASALWLGRRYTRLTGAPDGAEASPGAPIVELTA